MHKKSIKCQKRGVKIDLGIACDAKDFLNNVNIYYCDEPYTFPREWNNKINDWKIKYGEEKTREGDSVVYDYLDGFFENLPEDCIVIPDIGGNLVWTLQTS